MNSGIYKLFWSSTGYYYFGQAQNIKNRIKCHFTGFRHLTHGNDRLNKTAIKYGPPNWIVVEYCPIDQLNNREQHYLDLHFNDPLCCNLSPSSRNCRGVKHSLETRHKLSAIQKGKVMSFEARSRMSESQKGRILPPEVREKISKLKIGVPRPLMQGSRHPAYGKKLSPLTRSKISESLKGKSAGSLNFWFGKKGKTSRSRLVLNVFTGIYYDSLRLAWESHPSYTYHTLKFWVKDNKRSKSPFIYVDQTNPEL
jgi:group I intron endonuclease